MNRLFRPLSYSLANFGLKYIKELWMCYIIADFLSIFASVRLFVSSVVSLFVNYSTPMDIFIV